jgi:hypothetical protein
MVFVHIPQVVYQNSDFIPQIFVLSQAGNRVSLWGDGGVDAANGVGMLSFLSRLRHDDDSINLDWVGGGCWRLTARSATRRGVTDSRT